MGTSGDVPVVVIDHREPAMAARIAEVQRASYAVEACLIGYEEIPPLVETVTQVAALDLTLFGAVAGEDLLGVLGYRRRGDLVDVDRVAVHPRSFRQGIGRALIDHLHTQEADARRFEVSTGAANRPALALYRSMGYRPVRHEQIPGLTITHLAR